MVNFFLVGHDPCTLEESSTIEYNANALNANVVLSIILCLH